YGEYTVRCDADGYHGREVTVNVSGADLNPVIALVPEVTGDDAYVLLTWNGEHDLDLCAFNTELKEYVNIGHPIDSAGNVFLYADHGADMPYEVIYIHDADAEAARTFYVAEAENAREGEPSQMEADGVTVSVYDKTGLIYTSTADSSQTAALWCPCYYYAGVVYDQPDYINDASGEQYAWISFDEKDAYTADAEEPVTEAVKDDGWKQAYLEILNQEIEYAQQYTSMYPGYSVPNDRMEASLIFLNNDDIPEFVINNVNAPVDQAMYSYIDGKAVNIGWGDFFDVILGTGIYYELTGIDEGYADVSEWDGHERKIFYSTCLWDMDNDMEIISDEELDRQVSKYFDKSKSVNAMSGALSFEEMYALLSQP
ncbi:MAG: hypothetical protein K6G19_07780, partial [Lachnospiraceae bacterium]|nr:hypothetical protein [Lachnospiraceae bacterium]